MDEILGVEVRWGLAFMLGDTPVVFGDQSHPNAMGHLGGSATALRADPDTGLSYVYLSNSMLANNPSNEEGGFKTAIELGHSNPSVLWRHYHNLVDPEECERYWNIYPPKAEDTKITRISA